MSIISYFIRQFVLPNPFINMFDQNTATIVNWIFGGVFIPLAFALTGIWYKSEKGFYWVGKIGFLINYTILTYSLIGISSIVNNIVWIILLFILAYILFYIVIHKIFAPKYTF